MVDPQTTLGEQLLDLAIGERKAQVPADRKQDHLRFKLSPLEQSGNRWGEEHRPSLSGQTSKLATLPIGRPTSHPRDSARLPSPTPFGPHPRSSRHSIHIGHALGSGFVQSICSPPSRRPPFRCFPRVSRRDADLKILCSIPLTEYFPFRERTS